MIKSLYTKLKKRLRKKSFVNWVATLCFLSFLFVVYQLICISVMDNVERLQAEERESAKKLQSLVQPSQVETGQFICSPSGKIIPLSRLNDDYCDCPDGSDEPKTDACPNGFFHCKSGKVKIPSSRVNDGICDCCDGSDEWKNITPIIKQSIEIQRKTRVFHPPCPNTCPIQQ